MTSPLLGIATAFVRIWTRIYTAGLPADTRAIRRDEIDSDLWESMHDAAAPGPALILGRLLRGVPDDLVWRAARASNRSLAAAMLSLASAAVLVVWVYVNWLAPQTLPLPQGQPMKFVSERPQLAPPPPPPPSVTPH